MRTVGATDGLTDDLGLAVYEALANAVEHAYPPRHPRPMMRLQAQLNHEQVVITVSDQGCWRIPGNPGYRGRGLTVMRHLVTEVDLDVTARGTTVRLRVALTRADHDATRAGPPYLP